MQVATGHSAMPTHTLSLAPSIELLFDTVA